MRVKYIGGMDFYDGLTTGVIYEVLEETESQFIVKNDSLSTSRISRDKFLYLSNEPNLLEEELNDVLKAFVLIDEVTDDLNIRSDNSYGTGAIWSVMNDFFEVHFGEYFYHNLDKILEQRGIQK